LPDTPQADNVFTLRSLRNSQAIREALKAGSRLLLIGAGFIGAEVAASARSPGEAGVMVEAAPVPLARALGEDVGRVYAAIHRDHGVDVRTATQVEEWHVAGGRVTGVSLADGKREEGDVAMRQQRVLARRIRVDHWEVAKGQARGVATCIATGHVPYTKVPYFWSDQYDVSLEYRGQASGDDRAVWRGDAAERKFSVFYLRERHVDAVLSMNDKDTGETGALLIESRREIDDEGALTDLDSDLRDLLPPS